MALTLLSKTYWRGTQIRFREAVDNIVGLPVALDASGPSIGPRQSVNL